MHNSHGVNNGWKLAQTLVAAGLDIQGLDTISKEVHSESFKEASTFQQKDDTSIYCKFL